CRTRALALLRAVLDGIHVLLAWEARHGPTYTTARGWILVLGRRPWAGSDPDGARTAIAAPRVLGDMPRRGRNARWLHWPDDGTAPPPAAPTPRATPPRSRTPAPHSPYGNPAPTPDRHASPSHADSNGRSGAGPRP